MFTGSQVQPDGIEFFVISLQLSIAPIEQLQVILIVLLQMQKLNAQHTVRQLSASGIPSNMRYSALGD